jgi:hypothetical protein
MTFSDEQLPNRGTDAPMTASDRAADIQAAEVELLGRAREISRRITERVRKVLEDTKSDQPALRDNTDEAPPVG